MKRVKIGDKVNILNWGNIEKELITKHCNKGPLTVEELDPVLIGEFGQYDLVYGIYVEELPGYIFGPEDYELVSL